jgi:MinD-like ATPase involved in chromosome partitioning or flagellar assembly
MNLLGTIPYDERVDWSLKRFSPFLFEHQDSEVSRAILSMARALSPDSLPIKTEERAVP